MSMSIFAQMGLAEMLREDRESGKLRSLALAVAR